ncbi:hypothetical protein pdam_00018222 [Pocillopora damicornis]|uniref:Uncharacterized protein n=1 Tax=Pocillopora damicornis TaxID=46731 RepID=A0A3M6U6Y0_POCDA|nr:hypothetical protein pdam_00018222 [Pocillopora damicornis]
MDMAFSAPALVNPSADSPFRIFHRALDAKMKDATRAGVTLKIKKEEKVPVAENEEQKFWELGLLSCKALNHQTAHHLFPSVSQIYYPQITPTVAQTWGLGPGPGEGEVNLPQARSNDGLKITCGTGKEKGSK